MLKVSTPNRSFNSAGTRATNSHTEARSEADRSNMLTACCLGTTSACPSEIGKPSHNATALGHSSQRLDGGGLQNGHSFIRGTESVGRAGGESLASRVALMHNIQPRPALFHDVCLPVKKEWRRRFGSTEGSNPSLIGLFPRGEAGLSEILLALHSTPSIFRRMARGIRAHNDLFGPSQNQGSRFSGKAFPTDQEWSAIGR